MAKKFKSGFVTLIGRPNVGKSTLMNMLIGEKISIISSKPQTTRNKIQTILTTDNAQVVFIDTPMKVMNPEYKKIDVEPFNIWARNEIGKVVELEQINQIKDVIDDILNHTDNYNEKITKMVDGYVYNLGNSAEFGAKYIINEIQTKIQERKKEKKQ